MSESFKIKQIVAFTRCCEWFRRRTKKWVKCVQVKVWETSEVTKLAFSPPFQRLGSNQRDFSFSLTTDEWWTFSVLNLQTFFPQMSIVKLRFKTLNYVFWNVFGSIKIFGSIQTTFQNKFHLCLSEINRSSASLSLCFGLNLMVP